ncbi:DNA repair protein XRCC1-like [Schistocerca nitens]|uniref:DNA repair protein XRCC1-like n=1 Tax=Schistocerca nitens TaxID=7011 RepID=UPI00211828B5|nr:DNA repair protein XRCC1-like [Schistocerca nitens]
MPMIKFDRVVSCSSEDPNHPAKNLLRTETYKKWKCKNAGEDQISVVLQLEKSSLISSVDIGNEHSAFVEVLVARSSGDAEDFKVLLVASSFMTPMEARNGEHPNRVRMFSRDQLSKPAVDERWDRVKVVCRQPFNRHVQYGLTFLKLHTSQEEKSSDAVVEQHQTKLGRFVIREEDPTDDDIRVGSLFAVKHGATVGGGLLGGPHKPPPTGAAAIMDASKPSALASMDRPGRKHSPTVKTDGESSAKKKENKPAKVSPRVQEAAKEAHRNGAVGGGTSDEAGEVKQVGARHGPTPKRVKMSDGAEISAGISKTKDREEAPTPAGSRRPAAAEQAGPSDIGRKARASVPFHRLLSGVTLVISGYQNPLRANLREAALQMGAKYRPDWGPGCTHLVCAFPNTPKFNQVKGHGKIIRKEWVEDCHSQRKRLPWRRYAMDKKDQMGPESDTEEENDGVELGKDRRTARVTSPSQSEESTDEGDNAERTDKVSTPQPNNERPSLFAPLGGDGAKRARSPVAAKQGGGEQQKRMRPPPSSSTAEDDVYNADTDVDDDGSGTLSDSDLPPLPQLPDLFRGATFRLGPSLSEDTAEKLKRYISAYGGDVTSSIESANYLVTDRIKDCEKLKFDHSRCTAVRPAWVWECNDTRKLVPTAPYELE